MYILSYLTPPAFPAPFRSVYISIIYNEVLYTFYHFTNQLWKFIKGEVLVYIHLITHRAFLEKDGDAQGPPRNSFVDWFIATVILFLMEFAWL